MLKGDITEKEVGSKTPSIWVAMLLCDHFQGRRLTWWLCRRGFTMPSLPMLRPNEPGFHLNTNHFHKLEKHVVSNNTFKVTNTYTMVMFDLNHLGSLPQIIRFVVSNYMVDDHFHLNQLGPLALPWEGPRGDPQEVSAHRCLGGFSFFCGNIFSFFASYFFLGIWYSFTSLDTYLRDTLYCTSF